MAEDEVLRQHHRHNGHEFERIPGNGEGQGSLVCCSPWDHKELDQLSNKTTTTTSSNVQGPSGSHVIWNLDPTSHHHIQHHSEKEILTSAISKYFLPSLVSISCYSSLWDGGFLVQLGTSLLVRDSIGTQGLERRVCNHPGPQGKPGVKEYH